MPRIASRLVLIAALVVVVPSGVGAETVPDGDEAIGEEAIDTEPSPSDEETSTTFDRQHRHQLYEANRLHPWRAVAYTAALPGVGNFYAEQYALGTVAMTAMVFAGMFIGFGAMHGHTDLLWIGGATAGTAYLGGAVSSYLGARAHNRELKRSLHIDDDPDASGATGGPVPGLTLEVRF